MTTSSDPTEWPSMPSSHGTKPPVGPYRITDPQQMQTLVLDALKDIRQKSWPDDRLAKGTMRSILTMAWYLLDQFGYYGGPDEGSDEGFDEEPLISSLRQVAEQPIEDMTDTQMLSEAWLTADDVAARLRNKLMELRYWWEA